MGDCINPITSDREIYLMLIGAREFYEGVPSCARTGCQYCLEIQQLLDTSDTTAESLASKCKQMMDIADERARRRKAGS